MQITCAIWKLEPPDGLHREMQIFCFQWFNVSKQHYLIIYIFLVREKDLRCF